MVKTRRKRNNTQKKNTQKKRRNKQQKRNNTRKKLIMKKLFGGKNNICKCDLVGEGSSKKVYRYSLPVKDKLLVEIEVNEDDEEGISNAIIENLLLRQLHDKKKIPVVEVGEYTLNDKGNKTTISYFIEECGLNIEKKETTILIDLLQNENIMNSVKFLEEIMNCSIFEVDKIQHANNTLEGGLYLNLDCKSSNFCYQDNNSTNPVNVPVVKVMDVGINLLQQIDDTFTQTARLYVFILYCGLVYLLNRSSLITTKRKKVQANLKELSLELFKNTPNKEKIKMIQDISNVRIFKRFLIYYLLKIDIDKNHPVNIDLVKDGLTRGHMKGFLSEFMHKEFFEEKKQSIQNTEYTNNIGNLKTVTPDSEKNTEVTETQPLQTTAANNTVTVTP